MMTLILRILAVFSVFGAIVVCLFPFRVGQRVFEMGTVYQVNMPPHFVFGEPALEDVYYALYQKEDPVTLHPRIFSSKVDFGRTFFLMLAFLILSGGSYLAQINLKSKTSRHS